MAWLSFKTAPKKCLGIDIGTASIKIVELSRLGGWRERIKLENYGEVSLFTLFEKPFRTFERGSLLLSAQEISRAIKAILEEAKISTSRAVFSIPDFSTFFTTFELPPLTKKELPEAVKFEARRYIPLPLNEVTLDWSLIEGEVDEQKKEKLQILLLAVPNEVINQYREIAQLSQLQLLSLEAEVFSLVRSLIKKDKKIHVLIDIGAQSTTISIIDRGILKRTHSFDVSGNELTRVLANALQIDYKEAEDFKKIYGLVSPEKAIAEILYPLIDLILREIEKISQEFYQSEGKNIDQVILAGKASLLPGLRDYFFSQLKKEVIIANPFSDIFYPPILEGTLKEMGPAYAVAVGAALRGLE
jgi:type IV pilus assembly protein PilM